MGAPLQSAGRREPLAVAALLTAAMWGWAVHSYFPCCRGMRFLYVPMLGYLRHDLALAALSAETLVVFASSAAAARLLRARLWTQAVVAALIALAAAGVLAYFPDEFFTYPWDEARHIRLYQYNESVAFTSGGSLTQEEIDRVRQAVMSARSLWVHMSSAICIMHFNFAAVHEGHIHDSQSKPYPTDWSLGHGWVQPGELRSDFMTHAVDYPAAIREWKERENLGWLYERFRGMVAEVMNETAASVVFGGEATAEGLRPPGFHVYGHSVAFAYVVNPHQDKVYWRDRVGTRDCEPDVLSFSLTISMPTNDGGFFFWDSRGRNKVARPEGSMLVWRGDVAHALAPWSMPWYSDPRFRITMQAWGVTCGEFLYVYH